MAETGNEGGKSQCHAYNLDGQRCQEEPHLPTKRHSFTITWDDTECWVPGPQLISEREYLRQGGVTPERALRAVPTLGQGEVPDPPAEAGQVLVSRDGGQVWVDADELTDEEREAQEEAQRVIDAAIAEAQGDADDLGDAGTEPDEPETPTPANMPKRRRAKRKDKCFSCEHEWHDSECTKMIGQGSTKTECGCTTAVS